MKLTEVTDESKCCCSRGHNKRTDQDGHYIGYVANFETVCEEWEEDNDKP